MIRLPQWQFVEDESGQWHWTCVTDHVRVVSAQSFADRAVCLLNALQTVGAGNEWTSSEVGLPAPAEDAPLRLRLRDSLERARGAH
jgi:hypothetical protein